MSGMQELANRLLLHSVNQLSVKYPIHRNQIPLFIAWAPLAIPSCWKGTQSFRGRHRLRTLEMESDHHGEAAMKVGFVKFGFLHAGPDDAHGRGERSGQFFEDLVEVKQQVQRFWTATRERKLGFVVAFHHEMAARCKGVQHPRHVLLADGRRGVEPRAGNQAVVVLGKVPSDEVVHIVRH